jgi:hypothetical protein
MMVGVFVAIEDLTCLEFRRPTDGLAEGRLESGPPHSARLSSAPNGVGGF